MRDCAHRAISETPINVLLVSAVVCVAGMTIARAETNDTSCKKEWARSLQANNDAAKTAARRIVRHHCLSLVGEITALGRHSNPYVRKRAVEVLGSLGGAEAISVSGRLINDEHEEVALSARVVFCDTAPAECMTRVSEWAIMGSSSSFRRQAITLAERIGYAFDDDELTRLLGDRASEVGQEALRTLRCSAFENQDMVRRIVEIARGIVALPLMVNHPVIDKGYSAIAALGRCEVATAGPALIRMLDDVQRYHLEEMRTTILVDSVGKCAGSSARRHLERFATTHASPPSLRRITKSNIRIAREAAYEMLVRIRCESCEVTLAEGLEDSYYRVRMRALEAIKELGLVCIFTKKLDEIAREDESKSVSSLAAGIWEEAIEECANEAGFAD